MSRMQRWPQARLVSQTLDQPQAALPWLRPLAWTCKARLSASQIKLLLGPLILAHATLRRPLLSRAQAHRTAQQPSRAIVDWLLFVVCSVSIMPRSSRSTCGWPAPSTAATRSCPAMGTRSFARTSALHALQAHTARRQAPEPHLIV